MIDSRYAAKFFLIALAAFLLFIQIYHTLHYPIWFDDAFFSIVAKSLVNGEGYSAVFFDQSFPFHFGISSGPVVIMPAALLMFFFGNKYWVPDVANIVLIWSLLTTIFILSDDFVGKEKKWPFGFLALSLLLVFSTNSYGNSNTDRLVLWHLLMGEIPAALCLVIAIFLLFSPKFSLRKSLIGGIFLGLAVMSKAIAGLSVAVIFSFYFLKIFRQKDLEKIRKIQIIFAVGFCAITPFCLFEIAKLISLGFDGYLDLQIQMAKFYKENALILPSELKDSVNANVDIWWRINFVKRYMGVVWSIFAPMTFYISYKAFTNKNRSDGHCVEVGLILILCFIVHSFWWLEFSNGCDRYLVVGLISYFVGLALLIKSIDYETLWPIQTALIVIFVGLLFASRFNEINYLFHKGFAGNDDRLHKQMLITETIANFQKQGVIMISCGNSSELEYLLPHSRNFKKCEELLTQSSGRQVMLVNYYLNGVTKPPRVIRINSDQFYGATKMVPEKIAKRCQKEYLSDEDFSLNWCK